MKRLNRTEQLLARCCAEQKRGLDAAELAEMLGASRHNVSADLNQLWREGQVVKLPGRPVLFWDRDVYRRLHGSGSISGSARYAAASVAGSLGPDRPSAPGAAAVDSGRGASSASTASDPLSQLIGAQESLRSQVEQAKAAVLYPPSGLHTLVVGPTGVGKSHLAELMHAFALSSGTRPEAAPFVTLNCADYANNPQLLMAHLFGSVKGAYTGAEKEREGLVDHADGGILFLDEVHRLPAEGQEMLFRLIDKGLYRRLGETGPERQARIMLVAATTERIDSALLRTFTRRIPMVISLPSLAERTVGERFCFVRRFLRAEAGKIGVDIVVPEDTLRMLLEYECLGNIGQLRNDVQLACARLFLNYLTHGREPIELLAVHLPEHIHRTVPPARHRDPEVHQLLRSTGGRLVISKHAARQRGPEVEPGLAEGPISFYGLIEQQMQELQRQGKSPTEAERLVQEDLRVHFKDFLEQVRHRHQVQRQELSKLVGQPILRAVERAVFWAEDRLNRAIPERILYALALHVHASYQWAEKGAGLDYLVRLQGGDTPEVRVAEGVVELLARELGHPLPAGDVAFVTMLLRPESDEEFPHDRVGVVVVAHGQVASAMTDVAHALTGVNLAKAIDMPLDQDPSAIQELLMQLAEQGHSPGGLLLLVDMGSLEAMGQEVSQRTGVPVRTIGMVSSPLVVEAVHQASLPGATLDQVYQATLTCRSLMLSRDGTEGLPQVILTFCFTGVGSAHTLSKMVKEALRQHARRVDVIPASIGTGSGWSRLVSTLLQSHRLLAVVGPINPRIPGVPYVNTEEVVVGRGWRRLRQIVEEGTGAREPAPAEQPASAGADYTSIFGQMAVSLGEHLKVTNPAATIPVIAKGLNAIEEYLGAPLTDELRVGLMMHLVCLVERKVRDRLVNDSLRDVPAGAYGGQLSWLPEALREITAMFHVRFSDDELERLDEIISQSVSIPE